MLFVQYDGFLWFGLVWFLLLVCWVSFSFERVLVAAEPATRVDLASTTDVESQDELATLIRDEGIGAVVSCAFQTVVKVKALLHAL